VVAEAVGGPQADSAVSFASLAVPFSFVPRYGVMTRGVTRWRVGGWGTGEEREARGGVVARKCGGVEVEEAAVVVGVGGGREERSVG
jgi:hypothetical protein